MPPDTPTGTPEKGLFRRLVFNMGRTAVSQPVGGNLQANNLSQTAYGCMKLSSMLVSENRPLKNRLTPVSLPSALLAIALLLINAGDQWRGFW